MYFVAPKSPDNSITKVISFHIALSFDTRLIITGIAIEYHDKTPIRSIIVQLERFGMKHENMKF